MSIRDPVPVAGLLPLSTIDWPEKLCAVVFLRGCPWRCPYCHNVELQSVDGSTRPWFDVLAFLGSRIGLLDGVVFSGGEPLMHTGLAEAMAEVRGLGFSVGLHTAGAYPARMQALLEQGLPDWVGFDLKAPRADYTLLTGARGSGTQAWRSLRILVSSGVDYELRTTVYPPLLDNSAVTRLAHEMAMAGAGNLVLQRYHQPPSAAAPAASGGPELDGVAAGLRKLVGVVGVRG